MTRRMTLIGLTSLALLCLMPASASAARVGGPWPGRTITYFDSSRDKPAVARAVAAWNRTGVRIKFRRTFSARSAQLVIRNARTPRGCGTGIATLGYPGAGRKAFINILHGPPSRGQVCAWPGQTFVVAHELGHVLGLDHFDRRCSIMNSSHTDGIAGSACLPGLTAQDRSGQWRCRLIEPIDVRSAIRLYGGTARPPLANPWCVIVPRVQSPELVMFYNAGSNSVTVTIKRPPTPLVPPFLNNNPQPPKYEVYMSQTCPTKLPEFNTPDVYILKNNAWTVEVGQTETFTYQDPYWGQKSCLSAWAFDTMGRPSVAPSTVLVG